MKQQNKKREALIEISLRQVMVFLGLQTLLNRFCSFKTFYLQKYLYLLKELK